MQDHDEKYLYAGIRKVIQIKEKEEIKIAGTKNNITIMLLDCFVTSFLTMTSFGTLGLNILFFVCHLEGFSFCLRSCSSLLVLPSLSCEAKGEVGCLGSCSSSLDLPEFSRVPRLVIRHIPVPHSASASFGASNSAILPNCQGIAIAKPEVE